MAQADEQIFSLKKEMSALKQAWGASNSTRDGEYKALMKADKLKLNAEVEKAKHIAFVEGEESGQEKYTKAA